MNMVIKNLLFLLIIKTMGKKAVFFALRVFLIGLFLFAGRVSAQQSSFYFSVGYNSSWFANSNIHIEQMELGNSYDINNVKGNTKTNSPFSPLLLNYRLGFYFNEWQDLGMELNFDPVSYAVADGQMVSTSGTINNILNQVASLNFSRKTGSYYYFDGLNLILVNFVKRWEIYRSNTKDLGIDILGKIGLGPALPHFHSRLPINPTDNPQFTWGGWNYGGELAVRVTLYRYAYLEIAGKYDYAQLDGMSVYNGTARQNLKTTEVIASLGFTFPTSHRNPLFWRNKRILTMLPWYNHLDELGDGAPPLLPAKDSTADSLGGPGIPEFSDIVNKGEGKYNLDSLAAIDSIAKIDTTRPDTAAVQKKHSRKWLKNHPEVADSAAAPVADTAGFMVPPPVTDTIQSPKKRRGRKNKKHEVVADTKAAPEVVQPKEAPADTSNVAPAVPAVGDTTPHFAPEKPKLQDWRYEEVLYTGKPERKEGPIIDGSGLKPEDVR